MNKMKGYLFTGSEFDKHIIAKNSLIPQTVRNQEKDFENQSEIFW